MRRSDLISGLQPRHLGWLAIGGLYSAGTRGAHDNRHLGSLLVDPYWVGFYVTNFQDGFRRRALIGSLCRLLQPHGMSVLLINVLAVCALAGILALFVLSVVRLVSRNALRAPLFVFAFFASALGSVYFEVLGDTLQVAILIFALFAVLPALREGSKAVRLVLAVIGLVLAFFVHEASVFLLAPCIPFLVSTKVKLRDFALPAAAMLFLIGLSVHWSHLDTHLTYHAISNPKGISLETLAVTPGFVDLLRLEASNDFGSGGQIVAFVIKCGSILSLSFAGMVAAANSFSFEALRRSTMAMGAILLFSSPLWIIAHDWGRFLGYCFFLAALSASVQPNLQIECFQDGISKLSRGIRRIGQQEAFQCAALLLLLISPSYQSRIFGMRIRDFLSSGLILLIGFLLLRNSPVADRAGDVVVAPE